MEGDSVPIRYVGEQVEDEQRFLSFLRGEDAIVIPIPEPIEEGAAWIEQGAEVWSRVTEAYRRIDSGRTGEA